MHRRELTSERIAQACTQVFAALTNYHPCPSALVAAVEGGHLVAARWMQEMFSFGLDDIGIDVDVDLASPRDDGDDDDDESDTDETGKDGYQPSPCDSVTCF